MPRKPRPKWEQIGHTAEEYAFIYAGLQLLIAEWELHEKRCIKIKDVEGAERCNVQLEKLRYTRTRVAGAVHDMKAAGVNDGIVLPDEPAEDD